MTDPVLPVGLEAPDALRWKYVLAAEYIDKPH